MTQNEALVELEDKVGTYSVKVLQWRLRPLRVQSTQDPNMRLQSILTLSISTSLSTAQNVSSATSLPFNINQDTIEGDNNYSAPIFPILPFNKYVGNPILRPNPNNNWESAFLYNPTAIVLNETIFLLYRAQNASKTSSIGLAWSTDGFNFTRLKKPIIYATEPWEHIGGTEDPRIVRVNGTFYVTILASTT